MHTGISCCGNAAFAVVAGVACLAFVFGGYLILNSQTIRYPVEGGFDVDTEAVEGEDRISNLPDDVISSIISQLRTRDAVRTSVLSRRWRHIYTFVNKVKFRCADMYYGHTCYPSRVGEKLSELQRKEFVERVDTFLQHHSGSKIMSFELDCCFRGCISDSFRKWMNSVGTLGVEQLTVGFCCYDRLLRSHFPVFSTDFLPEASSVKHLWLRGGSFLTPNKNALTVLDLDCIALTSDAVESILANCSSLQLLNLRHCVLPSKLRIHGSNLQLKSLMIHGCTNVAEIDLSSINLITFEIYNLSILELSFSHVPLLQNLVIEFYGSEVTPYVFGKIAKDLPHLESLVFRTYASFFEGMKMDRVISKLSNIRKLVLVLEYHNKLDLLELATFLDACPLMHKFQLSTKVPSTFNRWFRKQEKDKVVRHDSKLKEVEFHGFGGTKNEYDFILYILKTVVSIERLLVNWRTIWYMVSFRSWITTVGGSNPRNDEKRRRTVLKRLQGQAISKNVEIVIL